MQMPGRLAKFISLIASPFFTISLAALLLINRFSPNRQEMLFWGAVFIFMLIVVPFLFIYLSVRAGAISDIHVSVRKQRIKPFLLAFLCAIIVFAVFYAAGAPWPLISMLWVMLANGIIFLIITSFWKISIHIAALAGAATLVSVLVNPAATLLFLLVPIVAWARVREHRHTFWQVVAPAILAPLVTLTVLYNNINEIRQLVPTDSLNL
ncbi:MAG: hypothetical protein AAB360_01935 [Patescibacteria group bacterium]